MKAGEETCAAEDLPSASLTLIFFMKGTNMQI